MTIDKIPTWLPGFPGFYNTIFEPRFEGEVEYFQERGIDCDEGDLLWGWDNTSYERAVLRCICDLMPSYFPKEAGILACKFEKIVSPKEYNFVNDSGNVTFEIDMALFVPWMKKHLEDHKDKWAKCLRRHYRSCDGFCSFYSDDPEDWAESFEYLIRGETPPRDGFYHRSYIGSDHLLGRLLDFYLGEHAEERMYYDVSDHVYVSEFIDEEKVKEHIKEKAEG